MRNTFPYSDSLLPKRMLSLMCAWAAQILVLFCLSVVLNVFSKLFAA